MVDSEDSRPDLDLPSLQRAPNAAEPLSSSDNSASRENRPSAVKPAPPYDHTFLPRPERTADEDERVKDASAAVHIAQIIKNAADTSVNVDAVRFVGAKRTRFGFLNDAVRPILFREDGQQHSLNSLLDAIRRSTSVLEQHEIFTSLSVGLNRAQSPLASPDDIDVILQVKEGGRVQLRTGTDLGNAEGSAYANANLRNVFGGAESVSANFATGTRTKSAYEIMLRMPLRASQPQSVIELAAYNLRRDNTFYASHMQHVSGGYVRFKWLSLFGSHDVQYSLIHRTLYNLTALASPSIIASAGESLLSSIRHTFVRDTRDDTLLPSHGHLWRLSQEIAGGPLSGDVSFLRLSAEARKYLAIGKTNSTIGLGLRAGLIRPLFSGDHSVCHPDRWQLGGPTDVRGFHMNGLGPRDRGDSVGGDVMLAGNLTMLNPIPGTNPDWPLRIQTFINGGSLLCIRKEENMSHVLKEMITKPSIAAGIGLVYRHPIARIEVNFCLPLSARESDRTRKGFQFGIGVDFM